MTEEDAGQQNPQGGPKRPYTVAPAATITRSRLQVQPSNWPSADHGDSLAKLAATNGFALCAAALAARSMRVAYHEKQAEQGSFAWGE
jgi:hypothetical protein